MNPRDESGTFCAICGPYSVPDRGPAEPLTEVVELEAGGTLSLLRQFDGTFRLMVETEGVNLGVPLTARDMRGIREGTGAMVLGSLLDVVR